MAKTPRSRNADDKVIQGKELDAYIKAELQAMLREGLESPLFSHQRYMHDLRKKV